MLSKNGSHNSSVCWLSSSCSLLSSRHYTPVASLLFAFLDSFAFASYIPFSLLTPSLLSSQLREKVDRAERLSSYPQAVVSQLEAQLEEYQQAAERLAASLSASIDKKCKTEQEEEIAMLERLRDDVRILS